MLPKKRHLTAPMISSLAAYMMVTGKIVPLYQTITWIIALGFLLLGPHPKRNET